jgi:hypothetical protein
VTMNDTNGPLWQQAGLPNPNPRRYDPPPKPKRTGRKAAAWIGGGALALAVVAVLAPSGTSDGGQSGAVPTSVGAHPAGPGSADSTTAPAKRLPKGVHHFGDVVRFRDGSTLTVSRPVPFDRTAVMAGGEHARHTVKFRATFRNGSGEVFDPSLTSASMSSGDTEGDAIYGEGFDSPDTKLLPGHTVRWWEAYGVKSATRWTVEMNVGFLDYPTVIFTNEVSG